VKSERLLVEVCGVSGWCYGRCWHSLSTKVWHVVVTQS